jgi:hypothetical protein
MYNLSLPLTFSAFLIGIAVYYFGKRKNLQLMDDAFKILSEKSGERLINLDLAEYSTMGRTYLVQLKPEQSLKNFRIHFALIQRHLILSRIASYFRKRKDYILIEADPTDKIVHRYQLEILPTRDQKNIKALADMLNRLEKMRIRSAKFSETFSIWANDPDFFLAAFQKQPQIIKNIYSQRNNINRVSIYPLESPSIRLVAEIAEELKPSILMDILFELTSIIMTLAKMGYYVKQRKPGIRIIEDKTIEEEKKKREKDRRYRI